LSEESVVTVCPNPECRREIEEPILLTILSVTPPKEYKACPYCFANLEPEPQIEQEEVPEPTVEQEEVMDEEAALATKSENSVLEKVKAGPRFWNKVKALIPGSNESQNEKRQKPEEPQAEPAGKKEEKATKEEPKTESYAKKESGSSGCPEAFGYLANRPPGVPIPQECLVCPKMVDCMLSPKIDETS
jgi:hypothetical protein